MAKPQAIKISSDSCPVVVNGETYYPHEGEHVWMMPVASVGDMRRLSVAAMASVRVAAVQGDADQGAKEIAIASETLDSLSEVLAPRIVKWTWTDLRGRPMPQPDDTALSLSNLCQSELEWLLNALMGKVPDMPSSEANEKKDTRSLLITSSVTERQPILA